MARVLLSFWQAGLVAPSGTSYDAINLILNAESEEERDELTKQWRNHKLEELNFIGVVGALLTGCLTSTGSWPTVLANGRISPWTVRACWYSGIVFALFAVLTAAQQSIRLHRLSAHKDALSNIRSFMQSKVKDAEGTVHIRPRKFQVFGWQASMIFLTLSVGAMLVGMTILIWSATAFGLLKPSHTGWWDSNSKLAVTWSIITISTIVIFVMAQISLGMRQDDM